MLERAKENWRLIRGMQARMQRANLTLVAAGGAFFAMLSLAPGLAAVIALLGFVADPAVVDDQLALLADFIPAEAFAIIDAQLRRLVATNSSTLGWTTLVTTLTALWSARLGTDAVIRAVNTVFGAPVRGGVRAVAAALAITGALILVVIVAILTMVVLPLATALLPPGPYVAIAIDAGRWVVAICVVFSGIWVLYRFAPNGPGARVAWLSPGAILAVVVWAAASWAFTYYVANFAAYNEVYGSIGAVIALLMFLYITILVVLLGASLNAELHAWRDPEPHLARDAATDDGPDQTPPAAAAPAASAAVNLSAMNPDSV